MHYFPHYYDVPESGVEGWKPTRRDLNLALSWCLLAALDKELETQRLVGLYEQVRRGPAGRSHWWRAMCRMIDEYHQTWRTGDLVAAILVARGCFGDCS
jgi:hypothetical protein